MKQMFSFDKGVAIHRRLPLPDLPWVRLAIIAAVLAMSLALPWFASMRQQTMVLGLVAALGAAIIFLRWPSVGLLALVFVALIMPSPKLPGGLNFAVLLLMGLTALWILDFVIGKKRPMLLSSLSRPVWPLIGLVIVSFVSFGVGQLPWFNGAGRAPLDTQIGGLAIFVLAPSAFLLVAYRIQDLKWLQWITWAFLAIGAFYVAGWFVPGMGPISNRLLQPGTTDNAMFWLWLVALASGQLLVNRKLPMIWRVALGIFVAATMYVTFVELYDWKSGWLPSLVALAVIVGLRYGLRHWWLLVLASPLGILAAARLGERAIASDAFSYSTRLGAWQSVLEMSKANLITGFGPANYRFYTPLFSILGFQGLTFVSHNQYVDIIAQVGLLGLACVLWFFGEISWLGWRLRHRAPAGFGEAYVIGALGGIAGTIVSGMLVDWFLPFTYNVGLTGFRASMLAWMFMGGLVTIDRLSRSKHAGAEQESTIE